MNKSILMVALAVGMIGIARADTVVSNTGNEGFTLFGDTVGYEFTVGAFSLSVFQLAANSDINGTFQSCQVGIWTQSGDLVASVTIPTDAPLAAGSYLWENLPSPVILNANTTYLIGEGGNFNYMQVGPTALSSDVSLVGLVRNEQQGVFSFPNAIDPTQYAGQAIVGPNMGYTVIPANQTISQFSAIATQTSGVSFTVTPPTASSGLPVTLSILSGPATLSGNTITPTAVGTVVLAADQSGNSNYNAATEVTTNITVAPANQYIPLQPIPTQTYGVGNITLNPTDSSGLPIIYRVTGPATLSNNILTITGAGYVSIVANQSGNSNYNAAPQVSFYFFVNRENQSIGAFSPIPTLTNAVPYTLTPPAASSGLPVTLSVLSGPATISNNTITPNAAGTVVLAADQLGNSNCNAATEVTTNITVAPANQSITSPNIPSQTYGVGGIPLNPEDSSGLPISYSVTGPATISNNILIITGVGTVTIIATQTGNSNYNAAIPVTNSFTVNPENQSIGAFAPIPTITNGVPYTLSPPAASSGLPVSVTVQSGPATIVSNTITPNGTGTVTLAADQSGNGNFNPASEVTTTFLVKNFNQTIAPFGTPLGQTYGVPFTIKPPPSSSGLPVTLSIRSGPATIEGNTITPTGASTITLAANQAGNNIYFAAPEVTVTILINKANQKIQFHGLPPQTASLVPLTLHASSSSGLGVGYQVDSGPASVSGNLLSLNGKGRIVVSAIQGGNTNYNAAKPVSISFEVEQASQRITFPPIATQSLDNSTTLINPTASSGLGVSVKVVSGPASIYENQVRLEGVGIVVLKASQKGDGIYAAAPSVSTSFRVKIFSQTIAPFSTIPTQTFGSAPFKITPPQASSNLPVTVTVLSGPAKISGNKITLTGTGTVVLAANQKGNSKYTDAPEVTTSFEVN